MQLEAHPDGRMFALTNDGDVLVSQPLGSSLGVRPLKWTSVFTSGEFNGDGIHQGISSTDNSVEVPTNQAVEATAWATRANANQSLRPSR